MNKKISKILQYIIFFGLGGYLLYHVFTDPEIDLSSIWQKILNAKWEWVGVSFLVGIITHFSRAMRWKLLLEGTGHQPKLINIYNAIMSGYFTNTAIPRAGEFVRCGLVKKSDNVPFTTAFGTAMVERLVDMFTLFSLLGLALFLQYDVISGFFDENIFTPISTWVQSKASTKNLIILGVVVIGGLYLLFKSSDKIEKAVESKGKGSIDDIVDDIYDGLGSILKLKNIGGFIFHSIFIWVGYFFINYFVFMAFGATSIMSISIGICVLVVGSVSKMLPTQAHGAGAFHFLVSTFLILYGIEKEDGLVIATVIHGSQFLYYVFGGAISYGWITFFTANNFVESKENENDEE